MTQPLLRLRQATEDDWEDILEADKQCFPYDSPPLPEGQWWVIEEAGHLAAYAGARLAYTVENAVYLSRAGVLPEYRGRRLQRRLVRARERWARGQGCVSVITDTYSNPCSMNTLIRCGYRAFYPRYPWSGEGTCYWYRRVVEPKSTSV